ncbi:MAG TPA: cytochrome P450 [Microthrixaceae bacterium]|nr:cytochrome P450 [Microthrixaceae bacterium]HMY87614.1 cytochrome P450 [Microthrixaceae bacterium]HNB94607.1 cytochrome P450 [Microthrixaceae bacterium]HNE74791.1 cytochrome P450 [Microthrixaceae bacterium]HNJ22871.1 cytochrome P450 [Microthrixaceae bacterium]
MTDTTTAPTGRSADIPKVSGDDGGTGHLEELRVDPIGLMQRVRDECGDVGEFRLADNDVVLLSGAEANEVFFRASDDELDQAAAYPFMTPIFGEGVVFDATPEERRRALHNQSLRDKFMRGHAATITAEIERMLADWDDEGEIDLLDWTAELFIYTSTSCLIGPRFREELDVSVAHLFHELERGTDAIAFVDPYADIDSFRRRDAARAALVERVQGIMARRRAAGPPAEGEERDLVDVLMSIKDPDGNEHFSADVITGMFISMMFAGHHTTSTTASWFIIEMLRNPDVMAAVVAEMDALADAGGGEITYQDLREVPWLEASIKETLRLHPPLILLLRLAKVPVEVEGYTIPAGKLVGASPAVSNRLPEAFDDPDRFDPSRYVEPRQDDLDNPWNWIPFGAGRHRCVGAAFAMMQLKTIFCILLRDWELTAAQPPETYRNDHSKMVVQLAQPCMVRYRRRSGPTVVEDGSPTGESA